MKLHRNLFCLVTELASNPCYKHKFIIYSEEQRGIQLIYMNMNYVYVFVKNLKKNSVLVSNKSTDQRDI